MSLYKKIILPILFLVFSFIVSTQTASAQLSTACGSCPGNPNKACAQWFPPNPAACTNLEWTCPVCNPCSTPPPAKVCPDVGFGSTPGSYCGAACVSCGVTSDRYYDANCNCVTSGTFSDPSFCRELCPAAPSATPAPPNTCSGVLCNGVCCPVGNSCNVLTSTCMPPNNPTSTPPVTQPTPTIVVNQCPDTFCNASAGETCSSCPQDCGICPTATPTPLPACNTPCDKATKCDGAIDGCTVCLLNASTGRSTCQRPPTPSVTATPTPPVCNRDCTSNADCPLGGGNTCTYCNPTTDKCEVPASTPTPTASPTPTNGPSCNSPCDQPADCQGAQNGCTVCRPNSTGNGSSCQPAPTASPTPTNGPSCNSPCDQPADCQGAQNGCTVCTPNSSGNGSSCQKAPTATPTPPFSEDMCACDGLTYTPLALGQTSTITAFGKVLGVNKNYATIPSIRFTFLSGNDPTKQKELKKETINTTIVLNTTDMVRYQAVWPLALDSSLDPGDTYRIQAKVSCVKKAAMGVSGTAVLAVEDKPRSFLQVIMDFFATLFRGGVSRNQDTAIAPSPTPVPNSDPNKKNLQLQTFRPATGVSTDNCTFIKFSF